MSESILSHLWRIHEKRQKLIKLSIHGLLHLYESKLNRLLLPLESLMEAMKQPEGPVKEAWINDAIAALLKAQES
jgi:hypothetical protein